MSGLPSFPGSPFSPFGPLGPGEPSDPLRPGSPGEPIHIYMHTHRNIVRISGFVYKPKDYWYFVSMDQHCWKTETSVNMAKLNNTRNRMLKLLPLEVNLSQVKQGFVI